jgi:hypothetical protein
MENPEPDGRRAGAAAPIPVPDLDEFVLRDGTTFQMDVDEAVLAFTELYDRATQADPPLTQRQFLETCREYVARQWSAEAAAALHTGQLAWLIDEATVRSLSKKNERADAIRSLAGLPGSTGSGRVV